MLTILLTVGAVALAAFVAYHYALSFLYWLDAALAVLAPPRTEFDELAEPVARTGFVSVRITYPKPHGWSALRPDPVAHQRLAELLHDRGEWFAGDVRATVIFDDERRTEVLFSAETMPREEPYSGLGRVRRMVRRALGAVTAREIKRLTGVQA